MDPHFDYLMDEILQNPKCCRHFLNMGQFLLSEGHFLESLGFLNKARKLGDDSFRLYFLLGKVYLFLSCSEKSLSHFKKALEKKPSHEETKYIINALDGERHVSARSLKTSVVKGLFDDYADKFENHLINKLNYKTPKKLVKFFLAQTEKKMALKIWEKETPLVLDLGCGTGLFARELKQKLNNSQIVGVDLSSQMLKQAIKKDVYFELYQEDLLKFLAQEKKKNNSYNLIAACDTIPYLGDLEEFFEKSCLILKPEGFLLFSFEALKDDRGEWFSFFNGRFKHGLSYVMSLAKKNNLRGEVKLETLREEKGERVKGCFFWGRSIKIKKTDNFF